MQEIFREVAEYIDGARRALFSQGDIEELKVRLLFGGQDVQKWIFRSPPPGKR